MVSNRKVFGPYPNVPSLTMIDFMMHRTPRPGTRTSPSSTSASSNTPHESPPIDSPERDRPEPGQERNIDVTTAALARLDDAAAVLAPYLNETMVPVGHLINPLLDVWDAAHDIDPYVSAPLEKFLPVLVTRTTLLADEVASVLDQVRGAALEASVLVGALS